MYDTPDRCWVQRAGPVDYSPWTDNPQPLSMGRGTAPKALPACDRYSCPPSTPAPWMVARGSRGRSRIGPVVHVRNRTRRQEYLGAQTQGHRRSSRRVRTGPPPGRLTPRIAFSELSSLRVRQYACSRGQGRSQSRNSTQAAHDSGTVGIIALPGDTALLSPFTLPSSAGTRSVNWTTRPCPLKLQPNMCPRACRRRANWSRSASGKWSALVDPNCQ